MTRLGVRLLGVAAMSALVLGLKSAERVPVVAHEWGTFTTVAAQDGRSERWLPLGGVVDLPCFVNVLGGNLGSSLGAIVGKVAGAQIIRTGVTRAGQQLVEASLAPTYQEARNHLVGTVRMETPVIYFYSPQRTTVSVTVDFPDGLITEWYPPASVDHGPVFTGDSTLKLTSSLKWSSVKIIPERQPVLLRERSPSHYYPARETDAAPIQVAGLDEKFLFYRGVGDFEVPIVATEGDDGHIEVRNVGTEPIPGVILFESRNGKIGYRALSGALDKSASLAPVELNGTQSELSGILKNMIMSAGMYEREADAMLATWKDSWFEEGARLFYLMPRSAVDEILPLTIRPAPIEVARAFVGRVELLTETTIGIVKEAIAQEDHATLVKYGRFLSPITERMLEGASPEVIEGAQREMTALYKAHIKRVEASCR